MTPTIRALAAVALLALAALAPAAAAKPAYSEQDDRLELQNEHLVVDLQGKKPLLQVSDATNSSRGYQLFLKRLVEVAPGSSQEQASFDLGESRDWDVHHTQEADGSITLTMHAEGPVKSNGPASGLPVGLPPQVKNLTQQEQGNASVTLAFHLVASPRTVGNGSVAVGTNEVKFDLSVARWPWASRSDQIALELQLVEQGGGNASGNATAAASQIPAMDNGTRVGWVGWAAQAQATTNGTAVNVTVEQRDQGQPQAQAGDGESSLHWLVYDAPGFDSLEHDPSVGIDPAPGASTQGAGGTLVPGFGAGALVALAAPAAALLAARRLR